MHILPRVLTALLLAAGPAAAAPVVKDLAGTWQGPVSTTPDGCSWKVTASVKERSGYLMGNFNYSGPCSKGMNTGSFTARPAEGGCYSVNAGVPGLPKLNFSACFLDESRVVFESMIIKGSLKIAGDRRSLVFESSSLLGGARGTLKKTWSPPASAGQKGKEGKKGKKGKTNAKPKPLKAPTLEIYGGGN
jgi:hypothetical protein